MKRCLNIFAILTSFLLAGIALSQGPFDVGTRTKKFRSENVLNPQNTDTTRNPDRGIYKGYGRSTLGAVKLLRAREVKQEDRGSGLVTIFDWDVKLIQDSMTVWCDKAFHWQRIDKLRLIGQVIMIDPLRRLDADEVIYQINEQRTEATGNVVMYRDSVKLTTQRGVYLQEYDIAHVYQDMRIEDWRRDIVLTGDEGIYEIAQERAEVPVEPVLIQLDSTGEEIARIESRFMAYNGEAGIAEARDSVYLNWDNLRGHCGRMFYYPDEGKALLFKEPVVWRERDEARGDSIWIYLDGDKPDSVVVILNARAYTAADTIEGAPRSLMTGQRIVMDFEDGVVARMQADEQARATYHIFESGLDKGSNQTSGDRIVLYFKNNALDEIHVSGGTEGTFYPPRLAEKVRKEK